MRKFKIFFSILFVLFYLSPQIMAQAPTATPQLSSPVNRSVWESTTPTLYWWMTGATSSTVFNVLVSTSSEFPAANLVVDQTVTGITSYTIPASRLVSGTKYYWKVKYGTNNSSVWSFTPSVVNEETNTPQLSAPTNGSTWETTTPTLNWWMTGTTSSTVFTVLVSAVDDFTSTVCNVNVTGVTNYTIPTSRLVGGTKYYWKIICSGNESAKWSFTPSVVNQETHAPQLSAPTNGSTWETTTPTLNWWMIGGTNSTIYNISISTSTNFIDPFIATVTGVNSHVVPSTARLINGMVYYWKVSSGPEESEVWQFKTTGQIEPPQFTSLGLRKSTDQITWINLDGNINTGFSTEFLALSNPADYYYLDIAPGSTTNAPLAEGYYGFRIASHPAELDAYFAGKGVVQDAEGWQGELYDILTGVEPTFYIRVGSDGTLSLVDGLLHNINAAGTTEYNARLRINPDYPLGTYTYTGTILGVNGLPSALITVSLTINKNIPQFSNLELKKSSDQSNWTNVSGNLDSGFNIELLPLESNNDYYYFEIASGATTNTPLTPGYYGFTIATHPAELDAYFAGKGVVQDAEGWQGELYDIITGVEPTFYIRVASDGTLSLVDGFLHNTNAPGTTEYNARLRINPDYPLGTYTYTGTILGVNGLTSDLITVCLNIQHTSPVFTNLILQQSPNQTNWSTVSGNLTGGFTADLLPVTGGFHYFNIGSETTINTPLTPGYYPFRIVSHPDAMLPYFNSKGVNAAATGVWEAPLYQIITGHQPTFYIKVNDGGSMQLVDGLQYLLFAEGNPMHNAYLRINDDYPVGTYTYTGYITGVNGLTSPLTVSLTVTHANNSKMLSIGSVSSNRGATVSIPVQLNLSGSAAISNFLMGNFDYDPTKLRFIRVVSGSGTLLSEHSWSLTGYFITDGQFGIVAVGADALDNNGVLFNIYFDVIGETAGSTSVNSDVANWVIDVGSTFSNIIPGIINYTVPAGPSTMRGDATCNYIVDYEDALAIIYHIYQITDPLSGQALINANADLTGTVDINDAMAIYFYLAYNDWDHLIPVASSVSVVFDNVSAQNNLIRIPISIGNSGQVNSMRVVFKYDQDIFGYQSFKGQNNTALTTASEVKPGEAQFTYLDVNPGAFSKKGEIVLNLKKDQLLSEGKIYTEYSINGGELKTGPELTLNLTDIKIEKDNSIPQEFTVLQNYPNPFNPSTTIQYALPKSMFVRVSIINMLGQEIKTLVNTEKNAGVYSVEWNGDDNAGNKVTSGIYIYKVTAGENVSSRKMVLLK